MQDFRLPSLNVYKKVAQELEIDQKYEQINVLLLNAVQTRSIKNRDHDAIILELLGMLTDNDKKV